MGAPRVFNTPVDTFVRTTGKTRKSIAEDAQVSASTLYKSRALDTRRGRLHWTSLVLIGIRMGVFAPDEWVYEDDWRLAELVGTNFVGKKGRPAPNFARVQAQMSRYPHLRAVA